MTPVFIVRFFFSRFLCAGFLPATASWFQYHSQGGGPTDWHLVSLGKYAIGGAGIVFTEETAVEERGRKTYECAGIYSDGHVPAYRRITDFIRGLGAIPAIQLGHAGRKASSDLPWKDFKPLDDGDSARGLKPCRRAPFPLHVRAR